MNFFKKTWLVWFLIIPIIFLKSNFLKGGLGMALTIIFVYWFIYIPILLIVGLVLNIRKNSLKNFPVSKDWKFWLWLIPLVIDFAVLIYILIFNSL